MCCTLPSLISVSSLVYIGAVIFRRPIFISRLSLAGFFSVTTRLKTGFAGRRSLRQAKIGNMRRVYV